MLERTRPENERYTYGLLERLKAGDHEAARELFSVHGERLRRAIRARLPREFRGLVEEEELVQETFYRALRSMATFEWRGQGAFLAWLVGIAVNAFREEAMRSRAARLRVARNEHHGDGREPALQDIAERDSRSFSRLTERLEDWELLEKALDHLGESDRGLIVHREILGQDFTSMAQDLGMTEEVVRVRVRRAMNRLAQWIEKHVDPT